MVKSQPETPKVLAGEAFNPKNTTPAVQHGVGSIILSGC